MKKMHCRTFFTTGILVAISATLFSFTSGWGGDSFTIHLNNKLVLQQYLHGDKSVKSLTLQAANFNDELKISFSHCGKVGKSRTITIKDQNNKALKLLRFEDANASMTCKVKDIPGLKERGIAVQLFYSSDELPKGQALAFIVMES
jgi:hypothetical protein